MVLLTNQERILIVNDDPSMLELLQRHLCSQGYAVITAPTLDEALRVLATRSIDLVITDLTVPTESGYDLISHIRKKFNHTEVIIVTGYATIRQATKAAKAAAAEYLIKPFTDEELFAVVQRVFRKRNVRQAMEARA